MKVKIEVIRKLLQDNPAATEFPFPAFIFENTFTTPRFKDTLIQAKLPLRRTVNFIEDESLMIPEIDSKIGTLVNLQNQNKYDSLNQARLAVNRFRVLDKLKKKKLRTANAGLVEKFSLNRMMKLLHKKKQLPTSDKVWQVSLNTKYLNTIQDAGSHMASFSHKSGNRSLTNYKGYFSMSSRHLSMFYLRLYDIFIKESVKFLNKKRSKKN